MPTTGEQRALALTRAHRLAVLQVRSRVTAFVGSRWDGLGGYRDADVERFVAAVVPVVEGGQRQVASLTDAFLSQVAAATLGGPPRSAGVADADVSGAALRGGVAPERVYGRVGPDVWWRLSQGAALADAVAAGRRRAVVSAETDLQLAQTHAARASMAGDQRVVGYRRVLGGSHDCGLCIVASTQRYHREQLMPIHNRCRCGVQPIYGDADPGRVVDPDRLAGVHAAIGERFGAGAVVPGARTGDYSRLLEVREHGEIGPVLTVRGQAFRSAGDLPDAA